MSRSWWYRFSFLLIVTIVSVMMVIPTLFNFNEQSSFPVKQKINLGLDLQGGLYMVLGIDFQKVYQDEIVNYAKKMERTLADEGIQVTLGELNIDDATDPKHGISFNDPTQKEAGLSKIGEFFNTLVRMTNNEGPVVTYGLSQSFKKEIEDSAVQKSIEVIRNRIDEFGVTEPEIVSLGSDRIVVQLPGVKDIERAKALIGKTAKLEFKMVNDEVAPSILAQWVQKAETAGINFKKGSRFSDYMIQLNNFLKDDIPAGQELVFERRMNKVTNEVERLDPYLVEKSAGLTGEELQDATVRVDPQDNRPYVGLTFKSQGAKMFEDLTGENVGRRMAIVLDGNVYSAPVIQTRIAGGNAQITLGNGNYNDLFSQARDLSLVLRAGALPVELQFEEQRVVGPSLGGDSIAKAEIASIIGAIAVFLFVIIYYKVSGVIATMTLVLNVAITLAFLVSLGATLTLPGIAGIALTVGMAIDANIIIYERIKEELAAGSSVREAVEAGFDRAFWTILDANLTTAVAGLALLNFGTGPIRGFAVTLLIGIVSTVYCSYFVSRVMFEFYLDKTRTKALSI